MTTTIGSGLGATFGYGAESTVGTAVVPTHFFPFQKEGHSLTKTTVQSHAMHGGLYDLSSRRAYVTHSVKGSLDLDVVDRGLGLMFMNCLGASAVTAGSGYTTQTFTPADTGGKSMTFALGKPTTGGPTTAATIVPFIYNGVKITDWTLSVAVGAQAMLSVSTDAWNETVTGTYTAPSYVAGANMLNFSEGAVLTGGTATTTSGITTVSGGAQLATVKNISIKGTNPLDVDRFFLGAAGTKAEQIVNGFRSVTGSMDIEFENLSDVYTAFAADTPTALQFNLTGPIITGSTHSSLQVTIPNLYFDTAPVSVDGPDVLTQSANFTALDDGVNNPIQIQIVTLDSSI